MDFLRHVQYFGVVFAALVLAVATAAQLPQRDKLRWLSTNFKTLLTWDPEAGEPSYDVEYAEHDQNWLTAPNCSAMKETECDLTNVLDITKSYAARMKKTTSTDWWGTSDFFNPYRQSAITAVSFSLEAHGANGRVALNITDPLTSIHRNGSLLTIRDVFHDDLKYRVSYQKVGSTRKKERDFDSNVAVLGDLEPHERYCFSVAAMILDGPSDFRLGAWSKQQCSSISKSFIEETTAASGAAADLTSSPGVTEDGRQELRVEVLVGVCLVLLLLLIIVITAVFCCRRRRRQQHRTAQAL